MKKIAQNKATVVDAPQSIYDPEPVLEKDLWFLPAPPGDAEQPDMPWPVAAREPGLAPGIWLAAEAAQYRALIAAVQAVSRFGARLQSFPEGVVERFALISVSNVLRDEGLWLGPEQIALYRALRMTSDDAARDLVRASWAVRRIVGGEGRAEEVLADLHSFLGRSPVSEPQVALGDDRRPAGRELETLSHRFAQGIEGIAEGHPITRAAYGFALWRTEGITPWQELLEPSVAAMILGAGDLAPFLPLVAGHRLDRHALQDSAGGADARLATFYQAARAGALSGLLELDRLARWQDRAARATCDLSGRTPPLMVTALLRLPIVSAELVSEITGCSRVSARRNLNLFVERGLVREVTGQSRFRFWTAQL